MDELDNYRPLDVPFSLVLAGPGREQGKQRTQALAPGIDQVVTDILHQSDTRVQLVNDHSVDGFKIGGNQCADMLHAKCYGGVGPGCGES